MRIPQEVTTDNISEWETAFFPKSFTHPSGAVRLTSHPEGFIGLWLSLVDRALPFPTQFLTDARRTLRQFVDAVTSISRWRPTQFTELLRRRVRVLVVGCGGTGSAIAAGLPYLHEAMVANGHPGGLHVTLMDGDTISATNCVRQPFAL